MYRMTRKRFLQLTAGITAAAVSKFAAAAGLSRPGIKLGISLYGYSGDYGATTILEHCLADAASIGAEGIELLSEVHIPDYPNPPDSWIENWHALMDSYEINPSCYGCRAVSRLKRKETKPGKESLEHLLRDIELAKRLGFMMVKPAWGGNSPDSISSPGLREMAQRALPYAEKHDIKLAPEIDGTMMSNPRETDAYLDLINRTRTRHLGITLDAGMFQRHPTRLISEAGAEVSQNIQPLLPYLFHLRARFRGPHMFHPGAGTWVITDELEQYTKPLEKVIPLLLENGYSGYISSEYEGPRYALVASGHLGTQHTRLKRLLAEV